MKTGKKNWMIAIEVAKCVALITTFVLSLVEKSGSKDSDKDYI